MSQPAFRVGPDEQARSLIAAMLCRSDIEWEIAHAIREAITTEREAFIKIVTTYLVFDSQRAVSWDEVQDCLAAIRART